MISTENLKSGAHAEVLLSENFLKNVLTTYWDSHIIPEQFDLYFDLKLNLSPPQTLAISNDNLGSDLEVGFDLGFEYTGSTLPAYTSPQTRLNFHIDLMLITEPSSSGIVGKVKMGFQLMNITGPIPQALSNYAGDDSLIPDILQRLNDLMGGPRILDLFGTGEWIHSAGWKFFRDTPQRSLGIYANLNLKKGPEPGNTFNPSLNVSMAENFQPVGQDLTFGIHPRLYDELGKDLFARAAKPGIPGTDYYFYPIESGGEVYGELKSIKVSPLMEPIFSGGVINDFEYTNGLVLTISGRLSKYGLKADFSIPVTFKVDTSSGRPVVKMHIGEPDIEANFWTKFGIGTALSWVMQVLTVLFSPAAALTSGLIGFLVGFFGTNSIAEAIAGIFIDETNEELSSSFDDLLDNRFTLVRRRLHPFYETHYQLLADIDHFSITDQGIAFSGRVYKHLHYEPTPNVIIKKAIGPEGEVPYQLYLKVEDFEKIETQEFYPDRLNTQLSSIFKVNLTELRELYNENKFHQGLLFQVPFKIRTRNNSIREILTISATDHYRIRNSFIDPYMAEKKREFNDNEKDRVLQEIDDYLNATYPNVPGAIVQLTEQMRNHLKQQMFIKKREEWLFDQEIAFRQNELPALYDPIAIRKATLHMSPNAFGVLQMDGLLAFYSKYQLIRSSSGKWYYRSKRNITTADNLSEFPRFEVPIEYGLEE